MLRLFLIPALAGALAFGSGSPVRAADAEDVIGVLAGIAAVAIIANRLEDRKERKDSKVTVDHRRYDDGYATLRRPGDSHRNWKPARSLPERCVRLVDDRRGTHRVLTRRCLANEGIRVSRLPQQCAFDVRTRRGPVAVYGAHCLKRNGWNIAQRETYWRDR